MRHCRSDAVHVSLRHVQRESGVNNRIWIGVGIVLAVLVGAAVIAAKASRGTGSSDAVSLRGEATADEKLLSDIRQYREQAATLAPDEAAERW
jgi:hypothetical protein